MPDFFYSLTPPRYLGGVRLYIKVDIGLIIKKNFKISAKHAERKPRAFAFANARLFEISCADIAFSIGFLYKLSRVDIPRGILRFISDIQLPECPPSPFCNLLRPR